MINALLDTHGLKLVVLVFKLLVLQDNISTLALVLTVQVIANIAQMGLIVLFAQLDTSKIMEFANNVLKIVIHALVFLHVLNAQHLQHGRQINNHVFRAHVLLISVLAQFLANAQIVLQDALLALQQIVQVVIMDSI